MNIDISFPVIVEIDEDNIFIVSCPIFKGCHSYGKSIDEAMNNLKEVIEICVEESNYSPIENNKYIGVRELIINKQYISSPEYA